MTDEPAASPPSEEAPTFEGVVAIAICHAILSNSPGVAPGDAAKKAIAVTDALVPELRKRGWTRRD